MSDSRHRSFHWAAEGFCHLYVYCCIWFGLLIDHKVLLKVVHKHSSHQSDIHILLWYL